MHKRIALLALIVGLAWLPGLSRPQSPPAGTQQSQQPPPPEQRVDINRASLEELLKVPGMTRTWAQRIVRYRPYRTKQDLIDQGVLPGEFYNRIKDYVIAHQDKK